MPKTTKEKLLDLSNELNELQDIFRDCVNCDDNDNASDLVEDIKRAIGENDIIGYSCAMNYLFDNDASLQNSINLALEYGYNLKDINSELLASLLYQDNLRKELYDIEDQIEDCFEDCFDD